MLPKLNNNQSVWVEITNPIHGGKGWEFGTCLWSPVYSNSKNGNKIKSWKIMEKISPGDIILNFEKKTGEGHVYLFPVR
ncbi:MAG: hypothetical protein KO464_03340 [Candidatus Methanofastidiosum sp.]|nr:hypothetical protein [Methanofastidiosum sp.]